MAVIAGTLDPTFGTGGELTIDPGSILSGGVTPLNTIVQTDGKTIAVGSAFAGIKGYVTQLSRYNPDGSLDSTFGSAGKLTTGLGSHIGTKQQGDGKILVVGTADFATNSGSILIARYNSNGSPDNTFGTNGTVTSNLLTNPFSTTDKFFQEVNGKVLLVSQDSTTTCQVSLYKNDGSLDTTFSIDGSFPYTGIEQADGKILVAAIAANSANNVLVRYNRDGSIDPTFGDSGSVPVVGGAGNLTRGRMLQQSDGKILLNTSGFISRYNLDGSLDTSFGALGSSKSSGVEILQQLDGKLIVGGSVNDFALSRYNNNGVLDTTFGTNGIVTKDFNQGSDTLFNITLGSDGKIFAAGKSVPGNSPATKFVATRFDNDLFATTNHAPVPVTKLDSKLVVKRTAINFTLPPNAFSDLDSGDSLSYTAKQVNGTALPNGLSFNPTTRSFSGTLGTSYTGSYGETFYLRVTATDKGGLSTTSDFQFALANSTLSAQNLDSSFGINGSYAAASFSTDALTRGSIVQADGKVVVNDRAGKIQLIRYNTDGSRDYSFKVSQIGEAINDGSGDVIQQGDGKILVRGLAAQVSALTQPKYVLSRFNSDGSVDTTFGTSGSIVTDFESSGYFGKLYERNGKIYTTGSPSLNQNPLAKPLKLNRYNSDGSLDSSFGTNGSIAINNVGINSNSAYDRVYEIEAQSDGKVLIAANIRSATVSNNVYLFRYNSDGSIDSTFGTSGKVTLAIGNNVPPAQVRQTSDGKILVAQSQYLTRYNTDGSIDSSFATAGVLTSIDPEVTDPTFQGRFISKFIQESDGKLIVVKNGFATSTGASYLVARYNLDGTLDNTFSGDFSAGSVANITQQSDGKIVVVGDLITQRNDTSGYLKNLVATRYANGVVTPPPAANNAPIVANPIAAKTATTGTAFSLTVPANTFTDPDAGDVLSYTATLANGNALPAWLTFNATTGLFSGTPATADVGTLNLAVKATDKGGLNVTNNFGLSIAAATPNPIPTPTPTPNPTPILTPIPGLSLTANNLFNTDVTLPGFSIKALSQKSSNKVNQIVMFAVDDATGKIGTFLPGAPGYLQAALAIAKPIFSTLGGSFFSSDPQQVAVNPNAFHQLIEIQDASISDLQQQLKQGISPTNVLYSTPDANGKSPIKVTENITKDGYQISINGDELVLGLTKLAGGIFSAPIGTKSQTLPEGRTIDLTDYANKTLKVDLNAKSDAAFNNNIGFYAVEDAAGTIKLADGTSIGVTDSRYAVEAVKKAIANAVLSVNKTDSKTGQSITGGSLYAPVAVSQGSLNDFVNANPTNGGGGNNIHAYFNYLGANPDKVDHFRLLGANTFGFEDIYGGGDRDFNDAIVNLKISV
jgi:uncharacterized delta-60 repeat protein